MRVEELTPETQAALFQVGAALSATPQPRRSSTSNAEDLLAFQIRAHKLPLAVQQLIFAPPRKFRADFAWPEFNLLLEVQGGAFIGGRHTSGSGFEADCERRCIASTFGFSMMEVTPRHIKQGKAIEWLRLALWRRGWKG